jgi:prepilin-type N-terminal cleavage/methylation domain-containing protein
MKQYFYKRGMSLAEVLVSISILSVMIFSIAGGISLTFSSVRVDRDITDAMSFAQQKIEHIRSDIIDTSKFSSLSDIPYSLYRYRKFRYKQIDI